ncbi:Plasmid pRiA4b ORF-3 family protein [Pseudomonas syringae pv. cilantro]|nr:MULTISPECIES: plasmid pRiA4b ORF-3 family protein [Pseudomonas syringae group]KPC28442.1 Plasmid pRiA4b ORF-3 family protein [Pseudomonas syringae pv. cilantro]KPW74268.1 Plasmid pRiA4b ORF-3 family protein [Pseudomonas syringae pv. coriandricola]
MVKKAPSAKPEADLLVLYIELKEVKPKVWRRVVVPETITLVKLHAVIQRVMGWEGGHLHEYEIGGERYGIPDADGGESSLKSQSRKTLIQTLAGKKTFTYLYDLGDCWDHKIKVEKKLPEEFCPQVPYCIDGANACPPEDVGGSWGYAEFLAAVTTPNHPEHDNMLDWYGDDFDPAFFDHTRVNYRLYGMKV